jgi:hypothetical protein
MRFMPDRFKPAAIADIPICRCKNATRFAVLRAVLHAVMRPAA